MDHMDLTKEQDYTSDKFKTDSVPHLTIPVQKQVHMLLLPYRILQHSRSKQN